MDDSADGASDKFKVNDTDSSAFGLSQADVREEHLYVGESDAELSLERH